MEKNFYPRPPGGGRPGTSRTTFAVVIFLSTPSGWRATCGARMASRLADIFIHALRVEGDVKLLLVLEVFGVFLSTPSGWRATTGNVTGVHTHWIFIHALRVEGDLRAGYGSANRYPIFIHALRVEGDDLSIYLWYNLGDFYPRPPGGGRRQNNDAMV